MNNELVLERQRLDARSARHREEFGRVMREIGISAHLAPLLIRSLRRLAPALPYVVLASAAVVLLMRLRLRGASRFLLFGGVMFDVLRLFALARSASEREVDALRDRGTAGGAR
jgi:hypothetical protein